MRKGDCMFAHLDSSLEILPKGDKENKRTGHFFRISVSSTMDGPSKELHFENFHILDKLLVCRFQACKSTAYRSGQTSSFLGKLYLPIYFALILHSNLSWAIPDSNHIIKGTCNFRRLSQAPFAEPVVLCCF